MSKKKRTPGGSACLVVGPDGIVRDEGVDWDAVTDIAIEVLNPSAIPFEDLMSGGHRYDGTGFWRGPNDYQGL